MDKEKTNSILKDYMDMISGIIEKKEKAEEQQKVSNEIVCNSIDADMVQDSSASSYSDTTITTTDGTEIIMNPYVSTTGTPYTSNYTISSKGPLENLVAVYNKPPLNANDLTDLKEEIEDKARECDSKMDEVFEQMKADREKTSILNPVFQYYVGMRQAYDVIIEKLNKYIKEINGD